MICASCPLVAVVAVFWREVSSGAVERRQTAKGKVSVERRESGYVKRSPLGRLLLES